MSYEKKRKSFFFFGSSNSSSSRSSKAQTVQRSPVPAARAPTEKKVRPFTTVDDPRLAKWQSPDQVISKSADPSTGKVISAAEVHGRASGGHERPVSCVVQTNDYVLDKKFLRSLAELEKVSIDLDPELGSPSRKSDVTFDTARDSAPTHRRHISEVDELVDHLDNFINRATDSPLASPLGGEDLDPMRRGFFAIDTKTSSQGNFSNLDSPIAAVSPLDLQLRTNALEGAKSHTTGTNTTSSASNTHCHIDTEGDIESACDQFSYATSTVSAGEIQQVAYGSMSGTIPLMTHLGSTDNGKSPYRNVSEKLVASPKQFRVVNEDKAHFYLNDTTEDESSVHTTEPVYHDSISEFNEKFRYPSPQHGENAQSSVTSHSGFYTPPQRPQSTHEEPQLKSAFAGFGQRKEPVVRSRKPLDKNVRLVSSYVEELRLKYFPTSNSLQPPPSLPIALKTRNNLELPQNIKVRIRTSSKQIGIKHGKAKQKLLSLETANEDEEEQDIKVDHTKEFRALLGRERSADAPGAVLEPPDDEVYGVNDLMAPLHDPMDDSFLRSGYKLKRSDTVTSYFTKNIARLRSGTLEQEYSYSAQLPVTMTPISRSSYPMGDQDTVKHTSLRRSESPDFTTYSSNYTSGLKVANPDSDTDECNM
ncbi:FABL113Wp [Eremothecium gossypii FDAG1]|nr:FABL113Wp [Eremothecium gossypii FDAG1]